MANTMINGNIKKRRTLWKSIRNDLRFVFEQETVLEWFFLKQVFILVYIHIFLLMATPTRFPSLVSKYLYPHKIIVIRQKAIMYSLISRFLKYNACLEL